MSKKSGTAEQILSLPKGGGAVQGLGETFQPDLHTGTGSYSIPLDIPNGPNDIAPKLSLFYHTGAGSGPFGMGFDLNLFTIQRSMDKHTPTYRAHDPLILKGGGELVNIGGGKYRLKVDTNGWQFTREGEGFRIIDNEGKYYRLGVSENARLFNETEGSQKTLSWHLEEVEDNLGYKVKYSYLRDGNELYIQRIDYSIYTVRFHYEERPDPLINGRAGFIITTRLRCNRIELLLNTSSNALVRRWDLTYEKTSNNGYSLLHQIKLTGFGEEGEAASLPVLTLGYTTFSPRRLERFNSEVPYAAPGSMQAGRLELIDWDGDGLPDLLEIGGGMARVWINKGNCIWANPRSIDPLPVPVALNERGTAFADMEGNGTADLLMMDRPLAGYYPHKPKGGFDQPVFWRWAPDVPLNDPNARLVDLNGDGITDLLVTRENHFILYYRQPGGGWDKIPQTIPRDQVPPVSLSDPHVHVADINGDGFQDLVRVDGSGVVYWPYLGNGMWGTSIYLTNPPVLQRQYDPKRMFFTDINGDGCADLVYVDLEQVIYWQNGGGTTLSNQEVIRYTPSAQLDLIRLADMKGSGTAGVLWSYVGATGRKTDYFYLDFTGGVKPYLLNRIDNGMGLVTEIEYGTSVAEATRDKENKIDWMTFLPFPVPVIRSIRTIDQVTSSCSLSRYRYHQGHYDGKDREFAGFGLTEIEEAGDEAVSPMLTRNWYHIGFDPIDPGRPLTDSERARLKVLRGKLLKTEVCGVDGSPEQDKLYMQTESIWRVEVLMDVNGIEVVAPRQLENRTAFFERKATPYRVTVNRNLAFDEYGNVMEQEQRAEDPRNPGLNRVMTTYTTFAVDPTGRFRSKPSRMVQRDENGNIIAASISYYDELQQGQVGPKGLLTKQETLVLTDEIVAQVYGVNAPDFRELGYHRRNGEGGWWINQVTYTRTENANLLQGTITNARGSTTNLFYDIHKIQPNKIIDVLGNVTEAQIDYRANKLQSLTDVNGAIIFNRYDPLGRIKYTVEPGASSELPTTMYTYLTDKKPVCVLTEERTVNGTSELLRTKVYLDGYGQVLEERVVVDSNEIVERSQLYSVRGFVKQQFFPYDAVSQEYTVPSSSFLHRKFRYDSIGRLIEVINSDGTVQKQRFEPGAVFLYDEEDNRIGGSHADTPTRHTYDPTGRIMEVSLNEAGRWISTHYEYDIKGNLLAMVNSANQRTDFVYDLMGRRLRTDSPDSGTSTFLYDANGNQVEKRDAGNEAVHFEFDELDRLRRVSLPATNEVTTLYVYHDMNRPAPPEAGSFSKGRVVKVIYQSGEETFGYDALGRVTRKEINPSGLQGQKLQFDYTYRARGEIDSITYPKPAAGTGRLLLRYEYNKRGMLKRIPNYIRQIDYNESGQRTRIEYGNKVVTTYNYHTHDCRLKDLHTTSESGTVLQHFSYNYDQVGNLLEVTSPDPKTAANYIYDNLYRLKEAATESGNNWMYQFDDLGNLTFKSDVGHYDYDSQGLLVSAGADTFTYTRSGQMLSGPWGESHYDSIGRLISVIRGSEKMLCNYNHEGRRVRFQVSSGTSSQDIYTPDEMISIENQKAFAYIMDGAVRVARINLGQEGISFLHGDHLGSTTLVTDFTGHVLQRVYYDPFGAVLENKIMNGEEGTNYLYTGKCWDNWADLFYMGARFYNPKLGRFLTPDTIIPELYQPQAWNRYSYVQNNPLRFIDPTGHFWEEIGNFFEGNWKYIVAAVAVVAVVALSIVTFGAAGVIAVGIGMAIGGLVGGISASAAGGDILLGVLVGMAVGGAAALGGLGIGAGMSAVLGAKAFSATVLTGALSGAVNGAAMGFAAGFAGGQGTAGQIWEKMLQGALVGAISGSVSGFNSYLFNQGAHGTGKLAFTMKNLLKNAGSGFTTEVTVKFGRELAAGKGLDPLKILSAGLGGAALGSFIKFGGNSGLPVLNYLKPEYIGNVNTIFAQGSNAVYVLDYADDLWGLLLQNDVVKSKDTHR
ncbi:hypothetical protein CN326_09725 [Bacillus sp. AFS018417]|uniref:toxin TcdB middle/N-terminal domain-containing protein n=1 Tax=Bacillus sp. AFS018417 TaxID=2033491 RepID=UPI000BF72D9C|nr:toxin TcdB middle/N-terminal domain-containing protein [Bacillus sp. AFS018417]PEZ06747.1 hypothetical protein CN326_09725 [Bacillus sp. AFS018417]